MIRKRWLGTLLASVLILSMAFGAVGYTETTGENKGQTERSVSDKNECQHSNLVAQYWKWDPESGPFTITAIDNMEHSVSGIGWQEAYCLDCGEIVTVAENVELPDDYSENHHYADEDNTGILTCTVCGHENDCEHSNLDESGLCWYEENVTYTPIDNDNLQHWVEGIGCIGSVCFDCGVIFRVEENVDIPDDVTDYHDYDENGICRDCGHKNTCKHVNLDEPEVIWEDVEWRDIPTDNEYHLATGTGREIAACLDCGEEITLKENVEIDEEEAHEYDENGICLWCDHKQLTGWQKIGGQWYFYLNGGAAVTGWKKLSGTWYYFKADGAMVTGWQKIGGKWYYFKSDGAMVTGWQKIGGKWYYFQSGGMMVTGWQKIGGKWYYFQSSGAMVTGWQKIGGKWYYFQSGGTMATGWQKIGGKWYYFQSSGVMVTGTVKIGGKTYKFSSNGVWVS